MGNIWQDLRYGARMLSKKPGFTLIAVITLALGIGANTAIFSVVNGVLLRALPFTKPEQIISVWATDVKRGQNRRPASYPNFADWRAQQSVFECMAAYSETSATLTGFDAPEQLHGVNASVDLFPLLGVQPLLGRWFSDQEAQASGATAVVISEGLWRRRFSADRNMANIIGRAVTLNGQSRVVAGVMPAWFRFPLDADYTTEFWLPLDPDRERGWNHLGVVARLKANITMTQAQAEMDVVASRITAQYPDFNTGRGIRLTGMQADLTRNVRTALLILLASVGCVLLIACANVANLLLARVAGRQKEIAVRAALGATRWRVIRQLLAESLLLAALGGASGLLLAAWGVAGLVPLIPRDVPLIQVISLDWRVLGVSLSLSLVTGVIFGLAPALQASKSDLTTALKEEGRGLSGGLHCNRTRAAIVIAEVALSFMLLVGAGLLMRSFLRLLEVNPGFNPDRVVTFDFALPGAKYTKRDQEAAFYQQLAQRVATLPGVEAAGVVDPLPLSNNNSSTSIFIEGQPPMTPAERPKTQLRFVSPDYLRALGIPLIRGRALTERDHKDAPKVMLINETFARRHFPIEDSLGKRVGIGIGDKLICEIVGVVGDVRHRSLDADAEPECYLSHLQNPTPWMSLVVRAASDDQAGIVAALRKEVERMDKEQAISDIRTMKQLLTASVAPRRFNLLMLSLFAGVALLLAAVGIYSVMAFAVTQRTHEIGIRMALGAQSIDVLKLVVAEGVALAASGVAIGLLASFALTRLMKTLLFGVSATDPLTFTSIALLLTVVALLACYIPARRAARVAPMIA
jgi:putative ABC transport system permease protein